MSRRPPKWWPKVINIPKTTTVLALGFLAGNFLLLPTLATLGQYVPTDYRESVADVVALFKDGMLLILGFYFRGALGAALGGSDDQSRSG